MRDEFKKSLYSGSQGNPLQDSDLGKYVLENGPDKGNGYLEALADFTVQIESIVGGNFVGDGVFNSGHIVRKKLIEFVHNNNRVLKKIKSNGNFDAFLESNKPK